MYLENNPSEVCRLQTLWKEIGMPTMEKTPEVLAPLFDFRVLLRYDVRYKVHVAQCIQTGSIVTSDSPEEALEMMKELLEDEISYAIRNNNMKNLFSSPAPLEVHLQWLQAAAENLKTVYLDVDFGQLEQFSLEHKNAHLTNKVEFALAA
jgi:hypothetical protein